MALVRGIPRLLAVFDLSGGEGVLFLGAEPSLQYVAAVVCLCFGMVLPLPLSLFYFDCAIKKRGKERRSV